MGRGLSDQQRRVLALGAALNAARNGGEVRPVEFVIDEPAGTAKVSPFFGPYRTRRRYVVADAVPDLSDSFVLVALGGFRRPLDRGWGWVADSRRRRPTSVLRKRALRERGRSVDDLPRDVYVGEYRRDLGLKWDQRTGDHTRRVSLARCVDGLERRSLIVRATLPDDRSAVRAEIRAAFGRKLTGAAFFLTAEAFAVVGDSWREFCGDHLLAMWEESVSRYRKADPAAVALAKG